MLSVNAALNGVNPEILEITMDADGDGARVEADGADLVVFDHAGTKIFSTKAADVDRIDVTDIGVGGKALNFFDLGGKSDPGSLGGQFTLAGFGGISLFTDGIETVQFTDTQILSADVAINDADSIEAAAGVASVSVGGDLTINAAGATVDLSHPDNDFTTVSVIAKDVVVADKNDVELQSSSITGDLTVQAVGKITDVDDAIITIDGDADFLSKASIDLADDAAANGVDTLKVLGDATFDADDLIANGNNDISVGKLGTAELGTVNFNTPDDVLIRQASTIVVTGDNSADNLELKTTGAGNSITDADDTSIIVASDATFDSAAKITLNDFADIPLAKIDELKVGGLLSLSATGKVSIGGDGTAELAKVTFNSANAVFIQDDTATTLTGINQAKSLTILSAGAISDDAGVKISVTNNAFFSANDGLADIKLGDLAGDVLKLGSVGFAGDDVEFTEADDTKLDGTRANNLTINSQSFILQTKTDTGAGTAFLKVADDTLMTLLTGSGSIVLLDGETDPTKGNDLGAAAASKVDFVNVTDDLRLRNISEFADLKIGIPATLQNLELRYPNTSIEIPNIIVTQDLIIDAGKNVTDDAKAEIKANTATISAGQNLELGNNALDVLQVAANASFSGGTSVKVGLAGEAQFGSLTFSSPANVEIRESGNTQLAGTSNAGALTLNSILFGAELGDITDATNASVTVSGAGTNDATLVAGGSILLGDKAGDVLTVDDRVVFLAPNGINVGSVGKASFGQLNFNSSADVSIRETGNMEVQGANTANNLSLTAVKLGAEAGDITDATTTSIKAGMNATLTADGKIELGNEATDLLLVNDDATIQADGDVNVGQAGEARFKTLTFGGAAVSIRETGDMLIDGTNTANSLSLQAIKSGAELGDISDDTTTKVTVNTGATFDAANKILLADTANDELQVGQVARFDADDTITVGLVGKAQFGSLSFDTTKAVEIRESGNMQLSGTNQAGVLTLTTIVSGAENGDISDATTTKTTVTTDATLTSSGKITLTDDASDVFTVTNTAKVVASDDVSIGANGTAEFGRLNFTGAGDVSIRETGNMEVFDANKANSLSLTAVKSGAEDGDIEDATTTSIKIATSGAFSADGKLVLADDATDQLIIGGAATLGGQASVTVGQSGLAQFGQLAFNSTGNVDILESGNTQLRGSSTAGQLNLRSIAFGADTGQISDAANTSVVVSGTGTNDATFKSDDTIFLGDKAGDVLTVDDRVVFLAPNGINVGSVGKASFGQLNFNGSADVSIRETGNMEVQGANTANNLSLTAVKLGAEAGDITDAATATLVANGDGKFTADGSITLVDQLTNAIKVSNDASFTAGDDLRVGLGGTAMFGRLSFNAGALVNIRETGNMEVFGNNTAADLKLNSIQFGAELGDLTDAPQTIVDVTNDAKLTAEGSIIVGNHVDDEWSIGDLLTLVADDEIQVGLVGKAEFGQVNFNTDQDVAVRETGSMQITGSNTAAELKLITIGPSANITDVSGTTILVNKNGSFTATGDIVLSNANPDELTVIQDATFKAATGTIDVGSLGNASFGTVSLTAADATITETGDMMLRGANVVTGSVTLTANSGNGTTGKVEDLAATTLTADSATVIAADSVELADANANKINVTQNLKVEAASTIQIGLGPAAQTTFGTLTFSSPDGVVIREDGNMELSGLNTAKSLDLATQVFGVEPGDITDTSNMRLIVGSDAIIVAGRDAFGNSLDGKISLVDSATNKLIVGDSATFKGLDGIELGAAGLIELGKLNFNSAGDVSIQESGDMLLFGGNTANRLALVATKSATDGDGNIQDEVGTAVNALGTAVIDAPRSIELADSAGDFLNVDKNATFLSGRTIDVGNTPVATTTFGSITFDSLQNAAPALNPDVNPALNAVSIQESNAMVVAGVNRASQLSLLTLTGNMTQAVGPGNEITVAFNEAGGNFGNNRTTLSAGNGTNDIVLTQSGNNFEDLSITKARSAALVDATRIQLGEVELDPAVGVLQLLAGGEITQRLNGAGEPATIVQAAKANLMGDFVHLGRTQFSELTLVATTVGERPDQNGVNFNPAAESSKNAGTSFDPGTGGLRHEGIQDDSNPYAVAIVNQGTNLQVNGIAAPGNVYIETVGPTDLTIAGVVAVTGVESEINMVAGADLIVDVVTGVLVNLDNGDRMITDRPFLNIIDPNPAFPPDHPLNSNRFFDPAFDQPMVRFAYGSATENGFAASIAWSDFLATGSGQTNSGLHEYNLGATSASTELTRREVAKGIFINSLGSIQREYDPFFFLDNAIHTNVLSIYSPNSINLFESGGATDLNETPQAFNIETPRNPVFLITAPPREQTVVAPTPVPPKVVEPPTYVFQPTEFYELTAAVFETKEVFSLQYEDPDLTMPVPDSKKTYDIEETYEEIRREILLSPDYPPGIYQIYRSDPSGKIIPFGDKIYKGIPRPDDANEELPPEEVRFDQDLSGVDLLADDSVQDTSVEADALAAAVWVEHWQNWHDEAVRGGVDSGSENSAAPAVGSPIQSEASSSRSTEQQTGLERSIDSSAEEVPLRDGTSDMRGWRDRVGTLATVGGALAFAQLSRRSRSSADDKPVDRIDPTCSDGDSLFSKKNRRRRRTAR